MTNEFNKHDKSETETDTAAEQDEQDESEKRNTHKTDTCKEEEETETDSSADVDALATDCDKLTTPMLCCEVIYTETDSDTTEQLKLRTPTTSTNNSNRRNGVYANAPDGGWGWVVTFSAFMISFILDGISFSFGLFFGELLDQFEGRQSETSAIVSVLNGTYLGIGPVASILVKRYGSRQVGVLGACLATVGFLSCTWSPTVHVMIVLYGFVGGTGLGLMYLPAIVTVGHYFDKRRALATGIAVCGSGIGSFVFAPLCEFLIETYTWKGAMWILSAVVLNCIPCAILLRPLEVTVKRKLNEKKECLLDEYKDDMEVVKDVNDARGDDANAEKEKLFDFELLKSPTFLLYGLSSFLATAGFFIPFTFIPGQVIDFGMTLRQSALLISIIGVFNTVTRVMVGWVSDRPWADASIINVVALLAGGVITILVPWLNNFGLFVLFCALFGFSIAVFVSLRSIIMAELLGVERLTSSFGLVTLCQGVAAFMGNPIAGALTDMSGDYKGAFCFSGLTIALAGLICIPLRRISNWENSRRHIRSPA